MEANIIELNKIYNKARELDGKNQLLIAHCQKPTIVYEKLVTRYLLQATRY